MLKGGVTLTGTAETAKNKVVVPASFGTGTITLDNVTINYQGAANGNHAFAIAANASVDLVLKANSVNKLSGSQQANGISVPPNATVTIRSETPQEGQSPGKVIAQSTTHYAMIGSARDAACGTINIQSGIVEAYSYQDSNGAQSQAPGIGGFRGGTVNITGGVVSATGQWG